MDFWLVSALLTFFAILIVMLPLTRKSVVSEMQGEEDRSVYIQQLKEVDADLARGLLDEASAEHARLEISRRILQNDRRMSSATELRTAQIPLDMRKDYFFSKSARWVVVLVMIFIPAVSWGIYALTGTPDLPSQPLFERKSNMAQDKSAQQLIAQAEAHLKASPDDGRGWAILAPIYLRLGRVDDSIAAYRKSLQLLGNDVDRLVGLGEALTVKANGEVTPEALAIFQQAGKLAPSDLRPPLMQVRALLQAGKRVEAVAMLQNLLNSAPENAPWRSDIEQTIANLQSADQNGNPAIVSQPGPTAADVDTAMRMDEQGRKDMIRSMVNGLAEKLRENPDDLAGWERLLRAYMVLNEPENALEALRNAAKSLPLGDMRKLSSSASALGLDVTGIMK